MFGYAAVERALAEAFGVSDKEQRGPFRGRIKHFQRLGIPIGMQPGRGQRIAYELGHVFQFALGLELCEFGMDPSFIAAVIHNQWAGNVDVDGLAKLFDEAHRRVLRELQADEQPDLFFSFSPVIMTGSWTKGPSFLNVRPFDQQDPGLFLRNVFGGPQRRAVVINVSQLVEKLLLALPRDARGSFEP